MPQQHRWRRRPACRERYSGICKGTDNICIRGCTPVELEARVADARHHRVWQVNDVCCHCYGAHTHQIEGRGALAAGALCPQIPRRQQEGAQQHVHRLLWDGQQHRPLCLCNLTRSVAQARGLDLCSCSGLDSFAAAITPWWPTTPAHIQRLMYLSSDRVACLHHAQGGGKVLAAGGGGVLRGARLQGRLLLPRLLQRLSLKFRVSARMLSIQVSLLSNASSAAFSCRASSSAWRLHTKCQQISLLHSAGSPFATDRALREGAAVPTMAQHTQVSLCALY